MNDASQALPLRRLGTLGISRLRAAAGFLAVFALPFALYLTTVAPTVYNLDSAELTTAGATGGLMRATGYPLYLLLARFWALLPFDDVGHAFNVLSAVFGAATIACANVILARLGIPGWARLGALGVLATSRYFWAMASMAEVYTLHTFLLCAVILALMSFESRRSTLGLAGCTFVVGLAFSNHVATVLLAPACLWSVLATLHRHEGLQWLTVRRLAAAAAGLAAGLSLYFYLTLLYWSDPAFNYAGQFDGTGTFVPVDLASLQGMWWLVSGKVFSHVILGAGAGGFLQESLGFGAELVRAFVAVGVGPALIGVFALYRRKRRLAVTWIVMFLATTLFYVNYDVIDKATMFLPSYLLWALFLAVGYDALNRWLAAEQGHRSTVAARAVVRAAAVLAVFFSLAWNGPLVDLSEDRSAYNRGLSVLNSVEQGALVIGWWSTIPVLEYLQLIEGRRPDVEPLNRFLISADDLVTLVSDRVDRGQAVYFDEPPLELFPGVVIERHGAVFQVHSLENPLADPGGATTRSSPFPPSTEM